MPRMSYKLEDILGAGVVGGDRLKRARGDGMGVNLFGVALYHITLKEGILNLSRGVSCGDSIVPESLISWNASTCLDRFCPRFGFTSWLSLVS